MVLDINKFLDRTFEEAKPENEIFAKRLYEAYLNSGNTRKGIAEETLISNNSLTTYFNGEKAPSYLYFQRLAKCLGVSYEYLYGECKAMQPGYIGASKELGLSGKAINVIKKMNKLSEDYGWDVVDYVFSNPLFLSLLTQIADIGYVALRKRENDLPIEDIGIIPIAQMGGTREILWSIQKGSIQPELDSSINQPLQEALAKRFGENSSIISAEETIKYISQSKAQKLLGQLMDQVIADAAENKLPNKEKVPSDDISIKLNKILSEQWESDVKSGLMTKEEHLDLLKTSLQLRNDAEEGKITKREYHNRLRSMKKTKPLR